MYVRKKYFFSDAIEVEEHHSARYGAPVQSRRPRRKKTPEQIAKINQLNRIRAIARLIHWNFAPEDYWLTITYKRELRPANLEEAKKDMKILRRKLQKAFREAAVPMKWIQKTEIGSRGGIHHHLLINRIPNLDQIITRLWEKGGIYIRLVYKQGGYRKLAEYIEKREGKEYYYSRSRNMEEHPPKVETMKAKTFRKIRIPQGYVLDPASLVEGVNPLGYPYRHYTLLKVEQGKPPRKRE